MEHQKEMARNVRRHHLARLKKARGTYYRYSHNMTPTQLGKVVATPASCSCWMCGNPRRKGWLCDLPRGRTLQEVKQAQFADSSEAELTDARDEAVYA